MIKLSSFIVLLSLVAGEGYAQQGTKKDPIPSDQSLTSYGGVARNVKYWDLLPSYDQIKKGVAYFTFTYDTFPAPDSFDLYYEGNLVYTTNGLVTQNKFVNLSVKLGASRLLQVIVNKDGNPGADTQWVYSIESRAVEIIDDNDSSVIGERGSAYITADSPPVMPKLIARVKNPNSTSQVRWKLQVKYGKDVILIPPNGRFTDFSDANQPWNIYEQYVDAQGNDLGFFGGAGTLTFQIDKQRINTLDFRIGGRNPSDQDCRDYLDSLVPDSAIAYPLAKLESLGYCGVGSIYNQFYDVDSRLKGKNKRKKIGDPIRGGREGFGIFQLTKASKPPFNQKWNWQANVAEGVRRLTETAPDAAQFPKTATALDVVNQLMSDLSLVYPGAEPMPSVVYGIGAATVTLSPLDAGVLSAYDGFKGCPFIKVPKPNGRKIPRLSCWTYDETLPAGTRWTFHANRHDFVRKVTEQVE